MREKVCPMLAIGVIIAQPEVVYDDTKSGQLPKCLKEDCGLWIEDCLGRKGYCGLIDKKER